MAYKLCFDIVTPIQQNVVYALPQGFQCGLYCDTGGQTFEQSNVLNFSENTQVQFINGQGKLTGTFIRCTTGNVNVKVSKAGVGIDSGSVAGSVTAANYVAVGANPAQSGAVRLSSDNKITWRNGTNTLDYDVLQVDSFGSTYLGGGVTGLYVSPASSFAQSVAIGTNPAQSGALRLANNQTISARNPANTFDIPLLRCDGSVVYLGGSGLASYIGAGFLLQESAQVVPGPDQAGLFIEDNGSGKTRLMVRFNTGVAIQIAIQV